jgi:hypothetical protein
MDGKTKTAAGIAAGLQACDTTRSGWPSWPLKSSC